MKYKDLAKQIDSIRAKVKAFRAKKANVRRMESPKGALQKAMGAYNVATIKALESLFADFRAAFDKIQAAGARAATARNKGVDFARLQYEAGVISNLVLGVHHAKELESLDRQIRDSGDTHKIRAWLERGPAEILGKFSGSSSDARDAKMFAQRLAKEAGALSVIEQSPEMVADQGELAGLIRAFVGLVQEAAKAGDVSVTHLASRNPYSALISAIKIENVSKIGPLGKVATETRIELLDPADFAEKDYGLQPQFGKSYDPQGWINRPLSGEGSG